MLIEPRRKSRALMLGHVAARLVCVSVVLLLLSNCGSSQQKIARQGLAEQAYRYRAPATDQLGDLSDPVADTAGLFTLLRYAAEHNPGVQAAFYRWTAAIERIPQAQTPPEPRLTLRHYFESVETRVGPQEQSFGLEQTFPWFGTLRLKGDIAAERALAEQARFESILDWLYFEVTRVWTELFYVERTIASTDEVFGLIQNAEAVAQAKYQGGSGPYADVIRAQVELGRFEDRLLALRAQMDPLRSRLNSALGRPADAPIAVPADLPIEALSLADEAVRQRAQQGNSQLRALDHLRGEYDYAAALARRRFYPSFTFGVDYIRTGPAVTDIPGSGDDPLMGRFSINLPIWWGSYRAGTKEAEAMGRATDLEKSDRESQLRTRLDQVLFAYHDADRKIELYDNALLPKARQSISASQTGYEAGEIDFLDLLDAQRLLLDFELAHVRARADRLAHLAEIRMLIGNAFHAGAEKDDGSD